MRTKCDERTHARTDRGKTICPPQTKSRGDIKIPLSELFKNLIGKIIEIGKTRIHDHSLSWLYIGTSIKSCGKIPYRINKGILWATLIRCIWLKIVAFNLAFHVLAMLLIVIILPEIRLVGHGIWKILYTAINQEFLNYLIQSLFLFCGSSSYYLVALSLLFIFSSCLYRWPIYISIVQWYVNCRGLW